MVIDKTNALLDTLKTQINAEVKKQSYEDLISRPSGCSTVAVTISANRLLVEDNSSDNITSTWQNGSRKELKFRSRGEDSHGGETIGRQRSGLQRGDRSPHGRGRRRA